MRRARTLDAGYFRDLYQANPDPWDFETSDYEAAKYLDTLAALGDERAASALEVGCSIGVLTEKLATVCDKLVATDLAPNALAQARRRCRSLTQVTFRLAHSTCDGMEGRFDLIVLSEVVYYWDDQDIAEVAASIARSLRPGGRLLLVHWTGETDYPKSADAAVRALADRLRGVVAIESERRTDRYRLDLWRRTRG